MINNNLQTNDSVPQNLMSEGVGGSTNIQNNIQNINLNINLAKGGYGSQQFVPISSGHPSTVGVGSLSNTRGMTAPTGVNRAKKSY